MITVENLSKSYSTEAGPVTALRDVTLNVAPGASYGVLGAAGAGKSTLTKVLALRDLPDQGTVLFDGVNTAGLSPRALREVRGNLAVLSEHARLRGERTVAGNIADPLEQTGADGPARRERVGVLLDLVGLTERANQLPADLSPGQRRRLALARAVSTGPAVLLADEPTGDIPDEDHGALLTVLDRVRAELGTTLVLTTRDAGVIRRSTESVALLEQGTIVAEGSLLDVVADGGSAVADALLPSVETPRAAASGYDQVADVVLVGFAAVGALLPEAGTRFDVDISVIGGGLSRFGDTPVARFRIGVRGARADGALSWIAERGGHLTYAKRGPWGVAA